MIFISKDQQKSEQPITIDTHVDMSGVAVVTATIDNISYGIIRIHPDGTIKSTAYTSAKGFKFDR